MLAFIIGKLNELNIEFYALSSGLMRLENFHIHKAQPSQSVYNVMHTALDVFVYFMSTCSRVQKNCFSLPLHFLAQHNQH